MKFTGNIDVLKGMQIKELDLGGCRNLEGNIEVFEGMQLKMLNLEYCENLKGDIESLKDCPLQVLNLAGNPFAPPKFTGDKEAFKKAHPKCDFEY